MSIHTRVLAAAAVVLALSPGFAAAPLTIKLATFAPSNSTWHKALTNMADAWTKLTEGRVQVIVYAGGTQGSDSEVIKLMHPEAGQLQAALLLQPGLAEIDKAFNVFAVPFLFESEAEFLHVQQALTPMLAGCLERKGFHLLNWGHAGWIRIFSKRPIRTLADLKEAKLSTSFGDPKWVEWYITNGFHPRPLSIDQIPTQLKLPAGMIDAAPSPPYGALSLQFYRDAPYMLDLSVAPLVSATIVTDAAWKKISAQDQARMSEASRAMERSAIAGASKLDADSIAAMVRVNLKVETLSPTATAEFRAAAESLAKTMRGTTVPSEALSLALTERDAFRHARR